MYLYSVYGIYFIISSIAQSLSILTIICDVYVLVAENATRGPNGICTVGADDRFSIPTKATKGNRFV